MLEDTELVLDRIGAVVDAAPRDMEQIERTLTDGYAQALALEAERFRLQRRLTEVAETIAVDASAEKAKELSAIVARLDHNSGSLSRLRGKLADLRQHADRVRA
jgi:septal ring factor EnvC (AmiA/AmiB activator)